MVIDTRSGSLVYAGHQKVSSSERISGWDPNLFQAMADADKAEGGERAPVCAFKKPVFKKKAGGAAIRKRARKESSESR